jgi:rod shape-determining protein MreC
MAARVLKRLTLVAALVALAAFLFLMPARFTAPARLLFNEAAGPAETAAFQGAGRALASSGTLAEMFHSQDRQRALERDLVTLRNQNAALADELRRERARLESLARLDLKALSTRAVRAPVSAYDTSGMRRAITVRAGTRDGVAAGMAVAADGALVGVVQQAGPFQSSVRLITDPESAVPCRLSKTREVCILQGTGGETCEVDWVNREAFIEAGDLLTTASLQTPGHAGLQMPDGLPAATITAVRGDSMNPLFFFVQAAPRVNVTRLEEVEILVPEAPGAAQ